MITKSNQFYRPVCDKCGAILDQGYSMGQVLAMMREAGWEKTFGDNGKDYCDKCKRNERRAYEKAKNSPDTDV